MKKIAWLKLLVLVVGLLSMVTVAFSAPEVKQNTAAKAKANASTAEKKGASEQKDAAAKEEKAPDIFKVVLTTTKGPVELEVHRDWAPKGVDRFYALVKSGFFTDIAFFRVLDGFVAQFGISGNPKESAKWREANITDDPVKESNKKGTLTFATAGKDTRTTQLFINLVDNERLDKMGFAPFAKVTKGMEIIAKFYAAYGEGAPMGSGPSQDLIQSEGNSYLKKNFPKLDYIKSAKIAKK